MESKDKITSTARVERCMQGGKLNVDAVRNYLTPASLAGILGAASLKPLIHYREMIQEREPSFFDSFMEASDPEAVAEYDHIVEAFNADIPRIKRENDLNTIKTTVEKLLNIALGTRV